MIVMLWRGRWLKIVLVIFFGNLVNLEVLFFFGDIFFVLVELLVELCINDFLLLIIDGVLVIFDGVFLFLMLVDFFCNIFLLWYFECDVVVDFFLYGEFLLWKVFLEIVLLFWMVMGLFEVVV